MHKSKYSDLTLKAKPGVLFETPIVLAHFDDCEEFVDELRATILAKRESDPDGLKRSNVGGWHSDTDMLSWGGEPARELIRRVISIAKKMSHFRDMSVEDIDWRIQMWANVSGYGASNHMHVHPGNIWSAAFYVDMGGLGETGDDTEGLGGEFYFEDPRFPMTNMHNTGFRLIGMDGKPQPVQPEIKTNRGQLVMFPSWLRHGVRPYLGNRERISIAMNLDA